jgi:hypothetical protein
MKSIISIKILCIVLVSIFAFNFCSKKNKNTESNPNGNILEQVCDTIVVQKDSVINLVDTQNNNPISYVFICYEEFSRNKDYKEWEADSLQSETDSSESKADSLQRIRNKEIQQDSL